MISYDGYLNRIQKLAKIKNAIHRFRFLIIGVFSLIVAAGTGLLMAKGAVTTQMSLPAEIVFGEAYAPTPASAFLSSVRYEYALDNGSNEWSSVQPVKAGKYLARTVTKKTFGNGYGKPIHFEILPRPATFSIGATSVTYGNVPTNCKVSDLLPGQNLVTDDLLFEYESYTLGPTQIDVVPSSVKIVDATTGEDYTSCYAITYNGKVLRVDPRKITVAPASWNHTYDGEAVPLKNELASDTLAKLAYGDTISGIKYAFVGDGVIKNKGEYAVTLNDDYTIMHGEIDVTALYDRDKIDGTLTIDPRPITITTGSDSKEYDGTPLSTNGKTPDIGGDGLVSGHTLAVFKTAEITNVAKNFTNTIEELVIADEDGTPVTDNYKITKNYGTLTINKRKIILAPNDDVTLEYNGEDRSATVADGDLSDITKSYHITEQGGREAALVSGHRFVGEKYTIKNVGSVPNGFANYHIYYGEERTPEHDVTGNYDIDQSQLGTLTITKRPITLVTPSGEKEYDKQPLSTDKNDITVSGNGLADKQKLEVLETTEITDAAENVTNAILRLRIDDENGDNVIGNYEITYDYGTLTITPRRIKITTNSDTQTYNGKPLSNGGYEPEVLHLDENGQPDGKEGLISGDTLTLVGDPVSITNAGTVKNENKYENKNYAITHAYGTLTVEKRRIIVTTDSDRKEYDGTALTCDGYTTRYYLDSGDENRVTDGLIGSDTLRRINDNLASITNVLETEEENNTNKYEVIGDNYIIDRHEYGTLTITKRQIIVCTDPDDKDYDGKVLKCPTTYTTKYVEEEGDRNHDKRGLLNNEELTLVNGKGFEFGPAAGTGKNLTEYNNDLANYNIARYEYGDVEIRPARLTITLNSPAPLTYGDTLSYPTGKNGENYVSVEGLVSGERIEVGVKFYTSQGEEIATPKNEGDYEIRFNRENMKIFDGSGKDGLNNYVLQEPVVSAHVHIQKKDVTVVWETDEITYGDPAYKLRHRLDPENLPYNESITVVFKYTLEENGDVVDEPRRVGTYRVSIDETESKVSGENGRWIDNGLNNYNLKLEKEPTTVTVVPKVVYVALLDDLKIEYGEDYSYPDGLNGKKNYKSATGLLTGDTFVRVSDWEIEGISEGRIPDVDTYTIKGKGAYIEDSNGTDKTGNYEIRYTDGMLEIIKRKLIVFTGDAHKEYDGKSLECTDHYALHFIDIDNYDEPGLIGEDIGKDGILTLDGKPASITNVWENRLNNNVNRYTVHSNNYEIFGYIFGTLTIDPRQIIVVTDSDSKEYDREPLTCDKYTTKYYKEEGDENNGNTDGLIGNDIDNKSILTRISALASITYFNDNRENNNENRYALNSGITNSKNYKIFDHEFGTLTITKRKILVTNKGETKVYDGTALENTTPDVVYNGDKPGDNPGLIPGDNLETDHTARVTNAYDGENGDGRVLNDTTYTNPNYDITYGNHGWLEVTARTLNITIGDWEKDYDRDPVAVDKVVSSTDFDKNGKILNVDNETLHIVLKFRNNDSGKTYTAPYTEPFGKGNYTISFDEDNSEIWGNDGKAIERGMENYNIEVSRTGTLTINPLKVTVTLQDIEVTYGTDIDDIRPVEFNEYVPLADFDGVQEAFKLNYYWFEKDGQPLEPDEILHVRFTYEVCADTEPGHLLPLGDTDFNNYDIKIEYGKLTVTPRPLTVQLDEVTAEYGDEETLNNPPKNYPKSDDIVYDDEVEITVRIEGAPAQPGRGEYPGVVVEDGIKINGEEYSNQSDYKITCKPGDLKINPKPISIELSAPDKSTYTYGETYDYGAGKNNFANYREVDTAYNETIEVVVGYYYKKNADDTYVSIDEHRNVGYYEIRLKSIKVYSSSGVQVQNGDSNYVYDKNVSVSFEIEKRQLRITIDSPPEKEYDRRAVTAAEVVSARNLADGETLEAVIYFQDEDDKTYEESYTGPFNVGTYTIIFDEVHSKIKRNGVLYEDGMENYDIEATNGTLIINPLKVTVTLQDITVTYGDNRPKVSEVTFKTVPDLPTFTDGQEEKREEFALKGYYIKQGDRRLDDGEILHAGEYQICADNGDIVGFDANTIPGNYEIEIVPGKLTVNARELKIRLKDIDNAIYGDKITYPAGRDNYDREASDSLVYGDYLEVTAEIDFSKWQPNVDPDKPGVLRDPEERIVPYKGVVQFVSATINGEEEFSDYVITECAPGNLIINPKPISIELSKPDKDTYTYGETYKYPDEKDNFDCEDETAYGETIKVAVYYVLKGMNDSVEVKNVGEYEIVFDRAHTIVYDSENNVVTNGIDNYDVGEVERVSFEIEKRQLRITIDGGPYECVYGDTLPAVTYSAKGLQYEEELEKLEFCYKSGGEEVTPRNVGTYSIEFVSASIKDPEDGIKNYNVQPSNSATLEITKRSITVTTDDGSRPYNGEPFSWPYITAESIDEFVNGDSDYEVAPGSTPPAVTHVDEGKVANEFEIRILHDEFGDVTENYNINYDEYGKIWITERAVTVVINDVPIAYGEKLPEIEVTFSPALIGEDEIEITTRFDIDSDFPEVGNYDIIAEVTGENPDYTVKFEIGKLIVEVRRIVIKSASATWTYDGQEHSAPVADSDIKSSFHINKQGEQELAFVLDHYLYAKNYTTVKDVVTDEPNVLKDFEIRDGAGNDVSRNYAIDEENGEVGMLTIKARPITVRTGDGKKEYDGNEFFVNKYDIIKGDIAPGQHDSVGEEHRIVNVVESGENTITVKIEDENGDNVTKNYDITYEYLIITITPRKIRVTNLGAEKEYDGKKLSNPNQYTTESVNFPEEEGLLNGDKLKLSVRSEFGPNVGTGRNENRYTAPDNYQIVENGYTDEELKITPRKIIVKTNDAEKIYDRTKLTCDKYTTSYYLPGGDKSGNTRGLIGTDTLVVDKANLPSQTEVGECPNALQFLAFENENYEIIEELCTYGTLRVTPRPLYIATQDDEKTYDGKEFVSALDPVITLYVAGHLNEKGLLDGDEDKIEVIESTKARITEAGSVLNVYEYVLHDTVNYYIASRHFGTLTVNPRPLTIELADFDNVLDYGENPSYPNGVDNYKNADGLVKGETLEIAVYYVDKDGKKYYPGARLNAGVYDVKIDEANCKVTGSEQGIKNYAVTPDPMPAVTVTIGKIELTIELNYVPNPDIPDADVYNGLPHNYPTDTKGYRIVDGQTAPGDVLVIAVNYFDENGEPLDEAPVDAGNYTVKLDADNCTIAGSGMDANVNYILHCANEQPYEYVIKRRPVTVNLKDAERTYNGKAFSTSEFSGCEVTGLIYPDSLEYKVIYTQNGEPVDPIYAGTYDVAIDRESIKFTNGIASNYDVDPEGSNTCTFTITPRLIRIIVSDRKIEYTGEPVNPDIDEHYEPQYYLYGQELKNQAFMGDDQKNADAHFYYLDKDNQRLDYAPSALGTYTICVEFRNEDIMKNYEVDPENSKNGKLEIVGRMVHVEPLNNGPTEKTYNGEEIGVEQLVQAGLTVDHYHINDDTHAREIGFAEEDFGRITITYKITDEKGVTVDTIRNAGTYYIEVAEITGYDENQYYVVKDESPVQISYVVTPKDLHVTRISDFRKEYDSEAPANEDIKIEYSVDELVPSDRDTCKVVPKYIGPNVGSVYKAGIYTIEARVDDPSGAENYNVHCAETGTLEITKFKSPILIKPTNKTVTYNGVSIRHESYDYEFVDKDNYNTLANGDDKIRITKFTPNNDLDPSRNAMTVAIDEYKIMHGTVDVTESYENVYFSYETLPDDLRSRYSAQDFRGTLAFEARRIEYEQIVPSGQSTFKYDGTSKTITAASGRPEDLYNIVSGDLAPGDSIVVKGSTIGPQVNSYSTWLRLTVVNAKGEDRSNVYNLVLKNAAESTISITALPITINVKPALTKAMLDDGTAFKTTDSFEGRPTLKDEYYTLNGTLRGHEYAVVAIKSSGVWNFAVAIYETKANATLTDRSDCYALDGVTGDSGLGVKWQIVECHSFSIIKSDITLTMKVGYDTLTQIVQGSGGTTYEGRPALRSDQYEIEGLLPGHDSHHIVVLYSGGKLTLAVLIASGKIDKSQYYNVYRTVWPDSAAPDVNVRLVPNMNDIRQDVTITFKNLTTENIESGEAFETVDGRLALKGEYYTPSGLITGHKVRIIPIIAGGKVTFEVLIYEGRPASTRTYLYNLYAVGLPDGVGIELATALAEIHPQVKITLNADLAETLHGGRGTTESKIDHRKILTEDMFTVDECFGGSPLLNGHEIEIVVDIDEAGAITLRVVIYEEIAAGKRTMRGYQYSVDCVGAGGVNVVIQEAPLGNEGL